MECKECLFCSNSGGCAIRYDLILHLLVFYPSKLKGASRCNRIYYLKRKGAKALYEKYGYKA